jgi:hypothetical protein
MHIDSEAERYGEIFEMDEEREKEITDKVASGEIPIIAQSNNLDHLTKLQDDLRKAGYKRLK